jgi:uroporphyrinogen decarboxylase
MQPTSRECVLSALNHKEPVKAPVDFGGHRSSGIMALSYRELRRYLRLPERLPRISDIIQQVVFIDADVLERFGVDTIELGQGFCLADSYWRTWELPGGHPCLIPRWIDVRKHGDDWFLYSPSGRPLAVQKSGMIYFDQIYWPYENGIPQDLSGLADAMQEVMWAIPGPPGPDIDAAELAAGARALREGTDKAIIGLFSGNLLEWGQFLCRTDNLLYLLAAEPQDAHRLLDRLTELHLEALERFLGAVGPYIDIIVFGDDLGMQTGPQISPAMYREFFRPRHAVLWRRAKELANVKVMLHSCGGIAQLLDDLISAGLDAVNPVQTSCVGMEPVRLKEYSRGRLCLWGGGCDTQHVLPRGTPEEVRAHVLNRLSIMAPGGGFVFQQEHNIQADVPPANITAMFDAVADYNHGLAS